MMQKPQSEYVLRKIKGKSFKKDRFYFEDLMFLERSVLGKVCSHIGSMKAHQLKSKYKDEHSAIMKELNSQAYEEFMLAEKEWKKSGEKSKTPPKWWKDIGGKD